MNCLPRQKLKESVKLNISYYVFDVNKSRYWKYSKESIISRLLQIKCNFLHQEKFQIPYRRIIFSPSIITCWRTYNCSPAMCLEGKNKTLPLVLAYLHLQEYTFYPSVFANIEVNYDKCLGIYNHQQQEIWKIEMHKSLSSGKVSNIVSKEKAQKRKNGLA